MKIHPITSSSEGNCTIVRSNTTTLLFDAGVNLKTVKPLLTHIDGIFISHSHSDHWKGAGAIARKYKCSLYFNKEEFETKNFDFENCDTKFINPGDSIKIGNLTVTTFSTKHDTLVSMGFLIEEGGGPVLCIITDTGRFTPVIKKYAKKANIIMTESDYDEESLDHCNEYDDWLKTRISSDLGHLCNRQVMEFIEELGIDNLDKVIIGHLSKKTNSLEILKAFISKHFPNNMDKFLIAPLENEITIKLIGNNV